jgi:galactokinase
VTDDLAALLPLDLDRQFRDLYGTAPDGIWRSPGRVNLIGEHTDYNDGLALPFAIDRVTFVAARRTPGPGIRARSTNLDLEVVASVDDLPTWQGPQFASWARYPLGVLWALSERGADIPGLDMVISSNVPLGSGLSSSAALTVAVATAVNELAGLGLGTMDIALVCQHAESVFAGVPCGLLDQVAVLEGKTGYAVLIDFQSMATELVPIGADPVVIIDTRKPRDNAGGAYANRRAACEQAAEKLGLQSLRQADLELVETELDGDLRKRARHVVTENARVTETARRLRSHEPIGDLLVASHISLRDDFEVSCPELDAAVAAALENGASGARLTGAGLGGCAIALGASAERLAGPMAHEFAEAGFQHPEVYQVQPSAGAGRVM